jgi:hypothetical protein
MKLEFSRQIFEKYSNIKFHENPSNRGRVVPFGRRDMTKQTVAFRSFANAPEDGARFRADEGIATHRNTSLCSLIWMNSETVMRE